MSKKDLASVTTDLTALASSMPTQRPSSQVRAMPDATVIDLPKREEEEVTQFSLGLRKELRKQLARMADDADMTMRAFVLNALKEKGLHVRDDDLLDRRKTSHR